MSMNFIRKIGLLALLLVATPAGVAGASNTEVVPASEREMVVLLHGLGRSSFSMKALAEKLEAAGYATTNVDYPSTKLEAGQLGGMLGERIDACCRTAPRVHFVTHSLGGIVVRAYLAEHRPSNLGRVVMLAPPNHGSEWVDFFSDVPVFRWVMGPTSRELGTDDESLPNRLPEADFSLGVIAGTGVINPLGPGMIPGDDDGTVSVESARLEGMTDFIEVDASHSFIMYSDEVAAQVLAFLEDGHFEHASNVLAAPPAAAAGGAAPPAREQTGPLEIVSPAFPSMGEVPRRYTCEGADVSPELRFTGIPEATVSLVLIVADPDAPDPAAPRTTWTHWVLYDLPAGTRRLPEAAGPADLPPGTRRGRNDWDRPGYGGPCPPIGRHRYRFELYALDRLLGEIAEPTRLGLLAAMEGHVLARAELVGTYEKRR